MKAEAIKQALHAKGFTFSMIANELGMTPNMISGVCYRRTTSKNAANAIAKILGKPVTEVFPDIASYRKPGLPTGISLEAKRAELRELLAS